MADLSRPLLTDEATFQALQQYFNQHGKQINMRQLFKDDPHRFSKYRWAFMSYYARKNKFNTGFLPDNFQGHFLTDIMDMVRQ